MKGQIIIFGLISLLVLLSIANVSAIENTRLEFDHTEADITEAKTFYKLYFEGTFLEFKSMLEKDLYIGYIKEEYGKLDKTDIYFTVNESFINSKNIYGNVTHYFLLVPDIVEKTIIKNKTVKTCADYGYEYFNDSYCSYNSNEIINEKVFIDYRIVNKPFIKQTFYKNIDEKIHISYLKENDVNNIDTFYKQIYNEIITNGYTLLYVKGDFSPVKMNDGYGVKIDHVICLKDKCLTDYDWWNTTYYYCMNITIPSNKVDSDLTDFPFLVTLNTTRINYSRIQSAGEDIRFINSECSQDGSLMPHEIELWNESGDSYIWVKGDLVNSTDNVFSIYFGNADVSDGQNVSGVWDSDYKMVQHFDETSGEILDSTSNDNNATNDGATMGDADLIDGNMEFVVGGNMEIADSSSLRGMDNLTISFIVDFNVNTGNYEYLLRYMMLGASDSPYYTIKHWNTGEIEFTVYDAADRLERVNVTTPEIYNVSSGTLYLSFVFESGNYSKIYVNGVETSTADASSQGAIYNGDDGTPMLVNAYYEGGTYYYEYLRADMDELRISNAAKSKYWINQSYLSETDNMITFGSEEIPNSALSIIISAPLNNSLSNDNTPTINFTVTDLDETILSCNGYFNDTIFFNDSLIVNNTLTSKTNTTILSDGFYEINISCSDGIIDNSSLIYLTINTTDPTYTPETPIISSKTNAIFGYIITLMIVSVLLYLFNSGNINKNNIMPIGLLIMMVIVFLSYYL